MPENAVIIDAATRFLRSNPELLTVARLGAGETGQRVEDLLTDAVRRVWSSGLNAVPQKDVLVGPPDRVDRGGTQRGRRGGPAVHDTRPRLVVVASRDSWRHGQEQFVHRLVRHQAAKQ